MLYPADSVRRHKADRVRRIQHRSLETSTIKVGLLKLLYMILLYLSSIGWQELCIVLLVAALLIADRNFNRKK
jgi:hypothetical protein